MARSVEDILHPNRTVREHIEEGDRDEINYYLFQRDGSSVPVALAAARAKELGICDIVLASYTGYIMEKALEAFSGQEVRLTAVGGARERFPADLLRHLEEQGHVFISHSEVGKSVPEVVANAYRRLSEGVKVCVEIVADAVEMGLLPEGTRVIAIAGTGPAGFPEGGGADTALVMSALATNRYEAEEQMPAKPEPRYPRDPL